MSYQQASIITNSSEGLFNFPALTITPGFSSILHLGLISVFLMWIRYYARQRGRHLALAKAVAVANRWRQKDIDPEDLASELRYEATEEYLIVLLGYLSVADHLWHYVRP